MGDFAMGSLHIGPASLEAILALVAGILVLLVPRLLHYVVGIYLIVVGALGLLHGLSVHHIPVQQIVALVAGVLVLVKPRLLHIVVGVYLIVVGLLGILHW